MTTLSKSVFGLAAAAASAPVASQMVTPGYSGPKTPGL